MAKDKCCQSEKPVVEVLPKSLQQKQNTEFFETELRSGDSDLCVIDSEENQVVLNSKGPHRRVKLNTLNYSIVDLTEKMGKTKASKKNTNVQKNYEIKEIIPDKSTEVAQNSKSSCTLECPVCFGYLPDFIVKITACGHIFCDSCITCLTNEKSPVCPICRKHIDKRNLRRVFLH